MKGLQVSLKQRKNNVCQFDICDSHNEPKDFMDILEISAYYHDNITAYLAKKLANNRCCTGIKIYLKNIITICPTNTVHYCLSLNHSLS